MPSLHRVRSLIGLLLGLLLAPTVRADEGSEFFIKRIKPILVERCLACHDPSTKKGGLDLSRGETARTGGETGPAVESGDPDASLLFEKVSAGEMPPRSPLDPADVSSLKQWIASGAKYAEEPLLARRAGPDWWSLRPIASPEVPSVRRGDWVRNPIDAFVLARLEKEGLTPSPEADRATLIRRLSFDLTGLPPTPLEVEAFQNDPRADAYDRLVDRLLDSPRHGERWSRLWLDAVRFGESHGYETNALRPNAWPYRDWAIRAFNTDLPLERFVAEQFAADQIPGADFLSQSATGFLVGGVHDVVGNQSPEGMKQQRADDLDDMITATGSAFLGLTVHCARCHDHKFDPIPQKDYYGLQAVFAGVEHNDRAVPAPDAEKRRKERPAIADALARVEVQLDGSEPLATPGSSVAARAPVHPGRNVERFTPVEAKRVRFTIRGTIGGSEPCLDELEIYSSGETPRNVALNASARASSTYEGNPIHALPHVNDGKYGNSWSWISREPGAGVVEVELPEKVAIDRVVWGRDREGKFLDRLASDYMIEVATDDAPWTVVASSEDRAKVGGEAVAAAETPERQALKAKRDELRARLAAGADTIPVYAGTFATPGPTYLLRRGDPMSPGEEVAPSGLTSLRPRLVLSTNAPEAERRMALARWIADRENPLPPRVMVNRVWHGHFGKGIVATPGDFGFNGDRPSHPELLDWLARSFLDNGGRLKPIHRLIVTSAAYRQSSQLNESGIAVDRDNRLLWRASPRRLEAEAIRDAVLATSGKLDLRRGGPGYSLWEPNTNYVVVFKARNDLGPETYRRMIYQFKPRSQPDPTFGAFDCPDAAQVSPRRNSSTTALQALNLLNSRFILDQSAAFAQRLANEAGDDPGRQIRLAFPLAFGRDPTEAEMASALPLVIEHGASALARAIFNANEFLYVR